MLIKLTVHLRANPVPWAIYTSPFFFLIAGTICALSIVYKGSPNLGLGDRPDWYIASVTLGTGGGLALLAGLFFVPFLYIKVIHRDAKLKWWEVIKGPLLWKRQIPEVADQAKVPNYAVVQHDEEPEPVVSASGESKTETDYQIKESKGDNSSDEGTLPSKPMYEQGSAVDADLAPKKTYKELVAEGRERFHARLRKKKGALGWAMRTLHDNPMGEGEIYEFKNMRIVLFTRFPAMVVVAALYGINYDIHAAQVGVKGTPEARRMERTYAHAKKYPNEVEHTYSFVQVITACTASFAHGANDIGNAAGPWAVIYGAWKTGNAAESESPVPVWQLAVLALTLSVGLMTYGFNIMKVMGNKITVSRTNVLRNTATLLTSPIVPLAISRLLHGIGRGHHCPDLLAILSPSLDIHVHHRRHCRCWALQRPLPRGQLAACGPPRLQLAHDHPHCWHTRGCHYGHLAEHTALCRCWCSPTRVKRIRLEPQFEVILVVQYSVKCMTFAHSSFFLSSHTSYFRSKSNHGLGPVTWSHGITNLLVPRTKHLSLPPPLGKEHMRFTILQHIPLPGAPPALEISRTSHVPNVDVWRDDHRST